jgi:hypothetical protein
VAKSPRQILRDQIRDRLFSIAEQAVAAKRISIQSDNLCDALDDIDNEVQVVIRLIDKARRLDDRTERFMLPQGATQVLKKGSVK